MGILSKTLASSGGYIAGDRGLIEYALSRGLIFSVVRPPIPPPPWRRWIPGREPHRPGGCGACQVLPPDRASGLDICGDEIPVASLIVGDDKLAASVPQSAGARHRSAAHRAPGGFGHHGAAALLLDRQPLTPPSKRTGKLSRWWPSLKKCAAWPARWRSVLPSRLLTSTPARTRHSETS
jgi:hypothetical protein